MPRVKRQLLLGNLCLFYMFQILKGIIHKNYDHKPFHGSQPCPDEGDCLTWRSYEPHRSWPTKMDGSEWRVLIKHSPLEEGTINYSSIIAMIILWTAWKGKKLWHWNMSPPGWKVFNMLWGKCGGHLLMAPERMKRLGQSRNDAHLCMCSGGKSKVQYCK